MACPCLSGCPLTCNPHPQPPCTVTCFRSPRWGFRGAPSTRLHSSLTNDDTSLSTFASRSWQLQVPCSCSVASKQRTNVLPCTASHNIWRMSMSLVPAGYLVLTGAQPGCSKVVTKGCGTAIPGLDRPRAYHTLCKVALEAPATSSISGTRTLLHCGVGT